MTFGGQVFLHAKLRLDETTSPVRVDYLHSAGAAAGRVSAGLMQWQGDEVQFVMAPPGEPVPADFECPRGSGRTLSRWKRS